MAIKSVRETNTYNMLRILLDNGFVFKAMHVRNLKKYIFLNQESRSHAVEQMIVEKVSIIKMLLPGFDLPFGVIKEIIGYA